MLRFGVRQSACLLTVIVSVVYSTPDFISLFGGGSGWKSKEEPSAGMETGHGWINLHPTKHHDASSDLSAKYVKWHGLGQQDKGGQKGGQKKGGGKLGSIISGIHKHFGIGGNNEDEYGGSGGGNKGGGGGGGSGMSSGWGMPMQSMQMPMGWMSASTQMSGQMMGWGMQQQAQQMPAQMGWGQSAQQMPAQMGWGPPPTEAPKAMGWGPPPTEAPKAMGWGPPPTEEPKAMGWGKEEESAEKGKEKESAEKGKEKGESSEEEEDSGEGWESKEKEKKKKKSKDKKKKDKKKKDKKKKSKKDKKSKKSKKGKKSEKGGGWGPPPMEMGWGQPMQMQQMGWGQPMQMQQQSGNGWGSQGGNNKAQTSSAAPATKGWSSGFPSYVQKLKPLFEIPKISLKSLTRGTGWKRVLDDPPAVGFIHGKSAVAVHIKDREPWSQKAETAKKG